ncbi:MAG: hypothetical protein KJN64_01155 [Ignavibacteria bacterium]|nr:hypothetical protein [Ignavibacteria bacterium]MBT8383217.1 hypothetical protein [Ignavibacteria bacterium]MBT8392174.1 hypothetical protein [Ignavibacteria bacterium]NNJ53834.1 hypothetical protein [Ignavibacteriaceae bacterium]NNL20515.1 hypothetical protein [Ignavibacteriaceae bacterium]
MSLNKILFLIIGILVVIYFTSCNKSFEPPPHQLFENPQLVLKTAKDIVGENISFTSAGHFESDSIKSIIAGVEINEGNNWGIKFHLIGWDDGEFKLRYSTNLLEGSFIQCLVDKIKFSDIETELIYYNSKNYFLGNAGGEIYSHIIDFKKLKAYSAHLSVVSSGRVSLDLSENIDNPMIKNFFVGYFKKDYPNLRLIERAI